MKYFLLGLLVPLWVASVSAGEPNAWTKLDKANIVGRRWDVPIGYAGTGSDSSFLVDAAISRITESLARTMC